MRIARVYSERQRQKHAKTRLLQLPTPIFLPTKIPGPPIPCQSWPHLYRFQTQKMLNYHDLVGSHIFAEYLASLDFRCASAKLSYKGDGLEWCRVCKAVMSMWIYAASLAVKMILRRNTESNKAKANHAADNNCKASGQRWPNAKGCCILQALSVSTCGQPFETFVWSSPNLKCRRRRLRCSESPPVPEFGLQTPPKILNSGTGGEDRHSIYIQFLFSFFIGRKNQCTTKQRKLPHPRNPFEMPFILPQLLHLMTGCSPSPFIVITMNAGPCIQVHPQRFDTKFSPICACT